MKKIYLCAAALALCLGTAAMLSSAQIDGSLLDGGSRSDAEINRLTSGAYRDGLYLGRLTAERGSPRHVASGRWATADNRELFTAGYEQGYQDSAPSAANTADGLLLSGDCASAVQRRVACEPILN